MAPRREVGSVNLAAGRPAGLAILVPGLAQWAWGQKERASVFLGSFCAASAMALFAWGTVTGLALLAFAFLVHAASAADAIRQGSFPGYGRWVPATSAAVGLGLGCYIPLVGLASALAWPGLSREGHRGGYLVNRWAYRTSEPRPGDSIWAQPESTRAPEVASVVASPGQEVERRGDRYFIDGKPVDWKPPAMKPGSTAEFRFFVPQDHVLVRRDDGAEAFDTASGLALIPRNRLIGRAWAQFSPFRNRRILPSSD